MKYLFFILLILSSQIAYAYDDYEVQVSDFGDPEVTIYHHRDAAYYDFKVSKSLNQGDSLVLMTLDVWDRAIMKNRVNSNVPFPTHEESSGNILIYPFNTFENFYQDRNGWKDYNIDIQESWLTELPNTPIIYYLSEDDVQRTKKIVFEGLVGYYPMKHRNYYWQYAEYDLDGEPTYHVEFKEDGEVVYEYTTNYITENDILALREDGQSVYINDQLAIANWMIRITYDLEILDVNDAPYAYDLVFNVKPNKPVDLNLINTGYLFNFKKYNSLENVADFIAEQIALGNYTTSLVSSSKPMSGGAYLRNLFESDEEFMRYFGITVDRGEMEGQAFWDQDYTLEYRGPFVVTNLGNQYLNGLSAEVNNSGIGGGHPQLTRDGRFTYYPSLNDTGTLVYNFKVYDSLGLSARWSEGSITINVEEDSDYFEKCEVNFINTLSMNEDPIQAVDFYYTTNELLNQTVVLESESVQNVQTIQVDQDNNRISILPDVDYNGDISFTLEASAPKAGNVLIPVTIKVFPVDDVPTIPSELVFNIVEDEVYDDDIWSSDPDLVIDLSEYVTDNDNPNGSYEFRFFNEEVDYIREYTGNGGYVDNPIVEHELFGVWKLYDGKLYLYTSDDTETTSLGHPLKVSIEGREVGQPDWSTVFGTTVFVNVEAQNDPPSWIKSDFDNYFWLKDNIIEVGTDFEFLIEVEDVDSDLSGVTLEILSFPYVENSYSYVQKIQDGLFKIVYIQNNFPLQDDLITFRISDAEGGTQTYSRDIYTLAADIEEGVTITHAGMLNHDRYKEYIAYGSSPNDQDQVLGSIILNGPDELNANQKLVFKAKDYITTNVNWYGVEEADYSGTIEWIIDSELRPEPAATPRITSLEEYSHLYQVTWVSGLQTSNIDYEVKLAGENFALHDTDYLEYKSHHKERWMIYPIADFENQSKTFYVRALNLWNEPSPAASIVIGEDNPILTNPPQVKGTEVSLVPNQSKIIDFRPLVTDIDSNYEDLSVVFEIPEDHQNDIEITSLSNLQIKFTSTNFSEDMNFSIPFTVQDLNQTSEISQVEVTLNYVEFESLNTAGVSYSDPMIEVQGELKGALEVNQMGMISYNLMLDLAPGRAGLMPKVGLNYSSHSQNSISGVGWTVTGFSAISRAAKVIAIDGKNEIINFNRDDKFELDGQQLVEVETDSNDPPDWVEYRIKSNPSVRVIANDWESNGNVQNPLSFTVYTPDGLISYYGQSDDAKIILDETKTFSWGLSKVRDTFGNYYSITYKSTEPLMVPEKINYTHFEDKFGNEGESTEQVVEFIYESEDRGDPIYTSIAGFSFKHSLRLDKIINKNRATELEHDYIKTWDLEYKQSEATGRSLVQSVSLTVQDFENDDGLEDLVGSINFEWEEPSFGFYAQDSNSFHLSTNDPDYLLTASSQIIPFDSNGDGMIDFWHEGVYQEGAHLVYRGSHYYSDGEGGYTMQKFESDVSRRYIGVTGITPINVVLKTLDINGDGKNDMARFSYPNLRFYLGTEKGFDTNKSLTFDLTGFFGNGTDFTWISDETFINLYNQLFYVDDKDKDGKDELLFFPVFGRNRSEPSSGDDNIFSRSYKWTTNAVKIDGARQKKPSNFHPLTGTIEFEDVFNTISEYSVQGVLSELEMSENLDADNDYETIRIRRTVSNIYLDIYDNGSQAADRTLTPIPNGQSISAAHFYYLDINQDGRKDLLISSKMGQGEFSSNHLYLLEFNVSDSIGELTVETTHQLDATVSLLADVDKDGMPEAVIRGDESNYAYVEFDYLVPSQILGSESKSLGIIDNNLAYATHAYETGMPVDLHDAMSVSRVFRDDVDLDGEYDYLKVFQDINYSPFEDRPVNVPSPGPDPHREYMEDFSVDAGYLNFSVMNESGIVKHSESFPIDFREYLDGNGEFFFVDLNNDQLKDWLFVHPNYDHLESTTSTHAANCHLILNRTNQFDGIAYEYHQFDYITSEVSFSTNFQILVLDLNNDGSNEIYRVEKRPGLTETLQFSELALIENGDYNFEFSGNQYVLDASFEHFNKAQFLDIDGNARKDLMVFMQYPDALNAPGAFDIKRFSTHLPDDTGVSSDLLVKVEDGYQNEVKIEYSTLTDKTIYDYKLVDDLTNFGDFVDVTLGSNLVFTGPMPVVKSLKEKVGYSSYNTIKYSYEKAIYSRLGGGFHGFHRIIKEHHNGTKDVNQYNISGPFKGYVEKTTRYFEDKKLSESIKKYKTLNHSYGSLAIVVAESETTEGYDYDNQDQISQKQIEFLDYDEYANPLEIKETVVDYYQSSDFLKSSIETSQLTNLTYDHRIDRANEVWWVNRIEEKTVTSTAGGNSQTRQINFTYHDSGSDTSGVLKEEIREKDKDVDDDFLLSSQYIKTVHNYDQFGNENLLETKIIIGNTETLDRTSSSDYGTTGQFMESHTNSLGTQILSNYHKMSGKVGQMTDINGVVSTITYMHDGTIKSIHRSNQNNNADTSVYGRYEYNEPDALILGRYFTYEKDPGKSYNQFIYDGYDREIRRVSIVQKSDYLLPQRVFKDTEYNILGQVERESVPYFEGTPDDEILWTVFEYDEIGRLENIRYPDGRVHTMAYEGNQVSTTISGNTFVNIANHNGDLVASVDALGFKTITNYGPFYTKQSVINEASDTVISMIYDDSGRQISLSDPDAGDISYTYDPYGNMLSQEHSTVSISMQYDEENRLIRRVEDKVGEEKRIAKWEYDHFETGKLGNGKLYKELLFKNVETGEPVFEKIYLYNKQGRLASVQTNLNEEYNSYLMTYAYDDYGRLKITNYPNIENNLDDAILDENGDPIPFFVNNQYNASGALDKIQDGNGHVYWEVMETNAIGQNEKVRYGNGIESVYTYKEETGQLKEIFSYDEQGNIVQDLGYHYNSEGMLAYREDHTIGVKEEFKYDALDRLEQSIIKRNSEEVATIFEYEDNGNIKRKDGVGYYQYSDTSNKLPHAVKAITSVENPTSEDQYLARYKYDDFGNMTAGDGLRLFYTALNKPYFIYKGSDVSGSLDDLELDEDSIFTKFKYDANHARYVKKSKYLDNIKTTYSIHNSFEEIHNSNGVTEFSQYNFLIKVESHLVAVRYQVQDISHLTSDDTHLPSDIFSPKTTYYLKDRLGGVQAITDSKGKVVSTHSFDAFGLKRNSDWSAIEVWDSQGSSSSFSGHEQLDEVGLVHMNGRIYSPKIARFLNPDNYVQDQASSQSFNRYSYGQNNPLAGTDPTGYFFENGIAPKSGMSKPLRLAIITIGVFASIIYPGAVYVAQGAVAAAGAAATGALVGGAVSAALVYAATGDARAASLHLAIGVVSFATLNIINTGVLSTTATLVNSGTQAASQEAAKRVALQIILKNSIRHGLVKGVSEAIIAKISKEHTGKAFWRGFASGFVNQFTSNTTIVDGQIVPSESGSSLLSDKLTDSGKYDHIISVAVHGVSAEISGASFEEGAASYVFSNFSGILKDTAGQNGTITKLMSDKSFASVVKFSTEAVGSGFRSEVSGGRFKMGVINFAFDKLARREIEIKNNNFQGVKDSGQGQTNSPSLTLLKQQEPEKIVTAGTLDQQYQDSNALTKDGAENENNSVVGVEGAIAEKGSKELVNSDSSLIRNETTAGDPVNVVTGEYLAEEFPDFNIPGRGFNLSVNREYRSQLYHESPFGFGWTSEHHHRVEIMDLGDAASPRVINYYDHNGVGYKFIQKAIDEDSEIPSYTTTGELDFISPRLSRLNLKYSSDDSNFILTNSSDLILVFDQHGRLKEKQDLLGNALIYEYSSMNGNYVLDTVKDKRFPERYLEFSYHSDSLGLEVPKISAITDFTGANVQYFYSDDYMNLERVVDLEDNETSYSYYRNQPSVALEHNMKRYTMASGNWLELNYYSDDKVSYHENISGNTFAFIYLPNNGTTITRDENGFYTTYQYNSDHDILKIVDSRGYYSEKTYDAYRNVTSIRDKRGYYVDYYYNDGDAELNRLSYSIDQQGYCISYEYDDDFPYKIKSVKKYLISDPNRVKDESIDSVTTEWEYLENGQIDYMVEERRFVEINQYGQLDQKYIFTDYNYIDSGNLLSEKVVLEAQNNKIFPVGYLQDLVVDRESYAYDANLMFLEHVTDLYGHSRSLFHDKLGRVYKEVDALDNTREISYNRYNMVTRVSTSHGSGNMSYFYTVDKKLDYQVNALGQETHFEYHNVRDIVSGAQVKSKTLPGERVYRYTYDGVGNLKTQVSPDGQTVSYVHDALGRLLEKTDPDGLTNYRKYDENGNVKEITNKRGFKTLYKYNARNLLLSTTNALEEVTTYEYDYAGRKTLTAYPNGLREKIYYDTAGQVVEKRTYSIDDPFDTRSMFYTYDEIGRVETEHNQLNEGIVYEYLTDVPHVNKIFAYGMTQSGYTEIKKETYRYNERNELVELDRNPAGVTHDSQAGENIESYFYSDAGLKTKVRDASGNLSQMTHHNLLNLVTSTNTASGVMTYFDYNIQNQANVITQTHLGEERSRTKKYDPLSGLLLEETSFEEILTRYTYDEMYRLKTLRVLGSKSLMVYDYDENGNKVSEKTYQVSENFDERVSLEALDASDLLVENRYQYDELDRLATSVLNYHADQFDRQFNVTSSRTYDEVGRIESETDPMGRVLTFQYNELGDLEKTINNNGDVVEYVYDQVGRKRFEYVWDGSTNYATETRYNKLGLVEEVRQGIFDSDVTSSTKFKYNFLNLLEKKVTSADSVNFDINDTVDVLTESYKYYKNGWMKSKSLNDDHVTHYTYHSSGQIKTVLEPSNDDFEANEKRLTTHHYGAFDRLYQKTLPNNGVTTYLYDLDDRVTRIIAPEGIEAGAEESVEYFYDQIGRQVKSKKSTAVSYTEYNELNQAVRVVAATGNVSIHEYSSLGWLLSTTQNTEYVNTSDENQYDDVTKELNLSLQSTNLDGIVTQYRYYSDGQLREVENDNGGIVSYEYNSRGLLQRQTDADDTYQEFEYDARGLMTLQTRQDGSKLRNEYDHLGRLEKVYVTTPQSIIEELSKEFEYDRTSKMTLATDYNIGGTEQVRKVEFKYDDFGREDYILQSKVMQGLSDREYKVQYAYDKNYNKSSVIYPSLRGEKRTFNVNDQIETISKAAFDSYGNSLTETELASRSYFANTRLHQMTYQNNSALTMTYNQFGFASSLTYSDQSLSTLYETVPGYSPAGQITRHEVTRKLIGQSATESYINDYSYDNLDHLTSDIRTSVDGSATYRSHQWTHDGVGNWKTTNQLGSSLTLPSVNGDNEYTNDQDFGELAPTTNLVGNMVEFGSDPTTEYPDRLGRMVFTYDLFNRLVKAEGVDGTYVAEYEYDALDRRVGKYTDNGITEREYIYDGARVIEEYSNTTYNKSYYYASSYVDDLLAQSNNLSGNDQLFYYLKDLNHSIQLIVNENFEAIESYDYNAYGLRTVINSPLVENDYGFTGRRFDDETGLWHYRNRMYSAEIGRFLQRDPLGYVDGVNMYAYVTNNPIAFVDPMGTMVKSVNGSDESHNKYGLTLNYQLSDDVRSSETNWDTKTNSIVNSLDYKYGTGSIIADQEISDLFYDYLSYQIEKTFGGDLLPSELIARKAIYPELAYVMEQRTLSSNLYKIDHGLQLSNVSFADIRNPESSRPFHYIAKGFSDAWDRFNDFLYEAYENPSLAASSLWDSAQKFEIKGAGGKFIDYLSSQKDNLISYNGNAAFYNLGGHGFEAFSSAGIGAGFKWLGKGILSSTSFSYKFAKGTRISFDQTQFGSMLGNIKISFAPSKGPDFVVSPNGTAIPKSQSRMVDGFEGAGFPKKDVISPTSGKKVGEQFTLPDGNRVRAMQPDGRNPMRSSFENSKGNAVNLDGKTVQPPKGMTRGERLEYIRSRTHEVQYP